MGVTWNWAFTDLFPIIRPQSGCTSTTVHRSIISDAGSIRCGPRWGYYVVSFPSVGAAMWDDLSDLGMTRGNEVKLLPGSRDSGVCGSPSSGSAGMSECMGALLPQLLQPPSTILNPIYFIPFVIRKLD